MLTVVYYVCLNKYGGGRLGASVVATAHKELWLDWMTMESHSEGGEFHELSFTEYSQLKTRAA